MSVALQTLDVVYSYSTKTGIGSSTVYAQPQHIPFDRNFTFNLKRTSQTHDVAINRTGVVASVPSDAYYEIKGKMPLLAGIGTTVETAAGKLLRCSGFKGPDTIGVTNTYTFSPLESGNSINLVAYTGKVGVGTATTNNALISDAGSVVFAPKMTFEHGKFGVIDFDGKGLATALPYIGNYPDTTSVTLSDSKYPIALSTTITINGQTYLATKVDIDFGVELALVKSMAEKYGYNTVMISNAKPVTFKASIMAADLSDDKNPFAMIDTAAPKEFELTYGTTSGTKVSITSGKTDSTINKKCQITDAVPGNSGGIKTLELTGIFIDNSIQVSIDNQSV